MTTMTLNLQAKELLPGAPSAGILIAHFGTEKPPKEHEMPLRMPSWFPKTNLLRLPRFEKSSTGWAK
jgi:hypothetical protein